MIKNWYTNHKEWLSLFSSAFVGTLLGIGITFGVSAYREQQHREEITRKYVRMTLFDIQNRLHMAKEHVERMEFSDSLFTAFEDVFVQKPETVDVSLALKVQKEYSKKYILSAFSKSESLNVNNMELLEFFDDLSLVARIGDVCTYTNTIDQEIRKIEAYRMEIYEDYCKRSNDIFIENLEETDEERAVTFLNHLYENPEISRFVLEYTASRFLISELTNWIQQELDVILEELQIQKEELSKIGDSLEVIEYSVSKE